MTAMRIPPRAALAAVAVGAALVLAGCGSAADPSRPTGVDTLVIPTPDPHPSDFVVTIDNPWLPLRPGARWTYGDTAAAPQIVADVVPGPTILGIRTTTLVRSVEGRPPTRDHFAQDRAGNVWWFGREGEWTAGVGGVEAGLAMPAHPRIGDGFRAGPETVVTVEDTGQEIEVPLATYDDTVTVEVRDGGGLRTEVYAKGVGLVRTNETGLVAYDEPR
jgi:hypothetical protein